MQESPLATALPTGTVTFLFTDVEGSTALVKRLSDRYDEVLSEHQRLLRETFVASGGREIDTQGDAFFVAFPRAKDAVAAAVAAQRVLGDHEWPDDVELRVRMGIHTGEPLVGAERYVGLGVHRAARICAAGHGGQILLSQATRELLRDDQPSDIEVHDLGAHLLKGLDEPEQLYQVLAPGIPDRFPPLKTAAKSPASTRQEFRILGPVEVVTEKGPVAIGGQKQRALLGILLMHTGEVVSTDRIVDALWGDHPPRTATTSLQNLVVQLRKLLGPDRVVTRAPGYALRIDRDELDLGRFERLVVDARSAEPDQRARRLREALALWRGEPFADFSYEAFAQGEIRRLEELRLAALEDRIDADLELGRHGELVGELESLVGAHALRERLRGQLMLALYRSGRQAEALQAYQDARKALVEELGIDPSPALQQLHRAILGQEAGLEPISTAAAPDHYSEVVRAMLSGRLVPVLGAGAASGRRPDELAEHLARAFDCPPEIGRDLVRISQYVSVTRGVGPLYDELHAALGADDEPGSVHRFIAGLPPLLRGIGAPQQLIVTTSYDLALERAFLDAGEEVDVVTYLAAGRDRGKFLHVSPDGAATVVDVPNAYTALAPDDRAVILKIHGQVDRAPAREWESFVVSEDDYISYLAQTDIAAVVPVTLTAKLRRSHFLFLGYPLLEWHLRVFLHRIWGDEKVIYRSWAVEGGPEPIAREYWKSLGVDTFEVSVEEYLEGLERRLAELEPAR